MVFIILQVLSPVVIGFIGTATIGRGRRKKLSMNGGFARIKGVDNSRLQKKRSIPWWEMGGLASTKRF
jgi:hypothetical protein